MSFSSVENARSEGKIVIGPRAVGLSELTLGGRQAVWGQEVEEEYLARVRARAQDAAKEILAQAMVEADRIKEQAREEGLQAGQVQAQARLDELLGQTADQCATVIQSLQQQGQSVWQTHRADLVLLVQILVEKAIAVELDVHRRDSLAGLLDQAVDMIEAKRRMVVTVHPRDRELLEDLLQRVRGGDTSQEVWKIKEDPQIQLGGLILECDHGMVDNTIASRQAGLREIVDQLTLEEQD
ncbi:FliH/SctL family protein [Desulfonatronum thioautotrophicum]|uniref:FliH/SctL family protein n=1 Tax=Desulfonatronum thioautotrophicum TaxID=617001 RepID=UPI0005EB5C16|nr:FliH/SctL family protein [Desulfonatronum thioautotrophicum]